MASDLLLTRDEVLGGLPAKRAAALLFLIESRTAHLVERARHTMTPFQSEDAARDRDMAFVEAFALGREPPLRPTIQDLERHAPQWADLVPNNPRLRAAVAHLLGEKYQFTATDAPALHAALDLDDDTVQQAYQRLYKQPLETIFTRRPSLATRLRWAKASLGARLESLPPFWTAFALTLTETVGAGILALPIALSGIGPLPGIIMLVILGLVNVVTVAWMAETAARTASVRYGGAYFGRLVTQYLGNAASGLLTAALVVCNVTLLLAYAIGLSTTLASATGVGAAIWIGVLFVTVGFLVSRDSIGSTVASALGIGAVNIVLVLGLAGLGFVHMNMANLTRLEIPGFGGTPFEVSALGLLVGAILSSYFGHTSIGNCAAVVLQRDPGARSLIWGVMAAQACAMSLYVVWVVAITGAISSADLASQAGTALVPLADVAGPSVYLFGSIFVVLAMGMGAVHKSLGLVNVLRERLPRREHPVAVLHRGQGRLVFTPRGHAAGDGPRLVLMYLGLTGNQAHFRLNAHAAGRAERVDRTGNGRWSARDAFHHLPVDIRETIDLAIETISADEQQIRLKVLSGMQMSYEGTWITPGVDLAGVLLAGDSATDTGPDDQLVRWILRQGEVRVEAAAAWAGQDVQQMADRLRSLAERGAIREVSHNGAVTWRARVAHRRARQVPDLAPSSSASEWTSRWGVNLRRLRDQFPPASGETVRRLLEYSPLVVILVIAEWMVLADRASFTSMLSFSGVIAVPIFAGIFPCLLLVSSRRKGDLAPGMVSRLLGQRWLTVGVYVTFLIVIMLHGLVIWQNPAERAAAIIAGLTVLVITVVAIRRGAFNPRTVVVLRDDQRPGGDAALGIVSHGHAVVTTTELDYAGGVRKVQGDTVHMPDFASLRRITTSLPDDSMSDLRIWANRITPDGAIESLPADVLLACGLEHVQVDLRLAGGDVMLAHEDGDCTVEIALDGQANARELPVSPGNAQRNLPRVDVHALLSADGPEPESNTRPVEGDRP